MNNSRPVHRPSPAHACRCGIRNEPSRGSFCFGVSPPSVIWWMAEWHSSGSDHALTQGGNRRLHRIEA